LGQTLAFNLLDSLFCVQRSALLGWTMAHKWLTLHQWDDYRPWQISGALRTLHNDFDPLSGLAGYAIDVVPAGHLDCE